MALDDPIGVYSTQPTVEIDGQNYPLVSRNLVSLQVSEALGGLSSLEVTVTDWVARGDGSAGFAADSGSPLTLGKGIRVFMGPAEVGAGEIFDGQITGIEAETRRGAPPLLTVLAEDRLFSARRKRQSRSFEQVSPADIATTIANDHGLSPEIRDGLTSPVGDWQQQNETDLGFLRRVLARFDGDVQIVGDKMQVGKIGVNRRSAVTLVAGGAQTGGPASTAALEIVRIVADLADQVTASRLAGFDPATGQTVTGEAETRGNGPGAGKTAADVLNEKFAAVTGPLGRHGAMTQSEADALAQADYDARARRFVRASGTAFGTAQLRVGTWITIEGVNPQFANDYSVIEAVHRFDLAKGYRTDFVAECAYLKDAA
jgi:uncharacterized protein